MENSADKKGRKLTNNDLKYFVRRKSYKYNIKYEKQFREIIHTTEKSDKEKMISIGWLLYDYLDLMFINGEDAGFAVATILSDCGKTLGKIDTLYGTVD